MLNSVREMNPQVRTFLIAAVGFGLAVWDVAFEVGAYNIIAFSRIFTAWITATTVLLGLIFLRERSPVGPLGIAIMVIPSSWMLLAFFDTAAVTFMDSVLFGLGIVCYLVSLPYTIYVIVSITNPEFFELKEIRLRVGLVLITILIALAGLFVGRFNFLFLTCEDFEAAGENLPANCISQNWR